VILSSETGGAATPMQTQNGIVPTTNSDLPFEHITSFFEKCTRIKGSSTIKTKLLHGGLAQADNLFLTSNRVGGELNVATTLL
jgi:hypothetical protein